MASEELNKKAEAKLQEAKTVLERIILSTDLLDSHCTSILNDCLRTKLIEDIDDVAGRILKEVDEKERDIREYPISHANGKVWIRAVITEDKDKTQYIFSVVIMDQKNADYIIAKMKQRFPDTQYTSAKEFRKRMDELKQNVSKRKFDILFGIEVNEILWNYVFPRDLD